MLAISGNTPGKKECGKRHGSNVGDSLVDPNQTDWKPQGLTRAHCRSISRATEGEVVESECAKSRTHEEVCWRLIKWVGRVRKTCGETRAAAVGALWLVRRYSVKKYRPENKATSFGSSSNGREWDPNFVGSRPRDRTLITEVARGRKRREFNAFEASCSTHGPAKDQGAWGQMGKMRRRPSQHQSSRAQIWDELMQIESLLAGGDCEAVLRGGVWANQHRRSCVS